MHPPCTTHKEENSEQKQNVTWPHRSYKLFSKWTKGRHCVLAPSLFISSLQAETHSPKSPLAPNSNFYTLEENCFSNHRTLLTWYMYGFQSVPQLSAHKLAILQFNFYINYLVLAQPHGLRAQPHKTSPISDTSPKAQVIICTSDQPVSNCEFSYPSPQIG